MTRSTSVFTFAGTLFLAIILSLIACDVTNAQGKGGGGKGGGGNSGPDPINLPDARFTVQRVDLDGMATAFGATSLECNVWDRELNGLGRLRYEDGSHELVLLAYTAEGYLSFRMGDWPEDGIFQLDETDPDSIPQGAQDFLPLRLTDDGLIIWRVSQRFVTEAIWEGEPFQLFYRRTEFVATPIEGDLDNGFSFGQSLRIKNFPAHTAGIQGGINRRGDLTYWSSESVDLEQIQLQEFETFEELALLWRADSNSLAYTESFFEVRLPVGPLNNNLQAANGGSTMQGIYRHYDIPNDELTEIGPISLNSALMSESGIVTANNSGETRGAIWDPFAKELIDFPLDIGDGRNTRFIAIDIQDLPNQDLPDCGSVIDVQIFGHVFNSAYDDLNGAPLYYEAGKAGFIKDLVVGDSADTAWFSSLDPPRTRTNGVISRDGSRIVCMALAWDYDSFNRQVVTDSSLVILHRVQKMTVDSITYADTGPAGRHLEVTVAVSNNQGAVSGASVSATLRNVARNQSWNFSGTTANNGTVTFQRSNAPSGDYELTINSIDHPYIDWDEEYSDPGHSR